MGQKIAFLSIFGISIFLLFSFQTINLEDSYIDISDRAKYTNYSSTKIIATQDSTFIGLWKKVYSKHMIHYKLIYSKNDSIFYDEYKINYSFEDSINGGDFFELIMPDTLNSTTRKYDKYYVKYPMYQQDINGYSFLSPSEGKYYFLDSTGFFYKMSINAENLDSLVQYKYFPVESFESEFKAYIEQPLKEANFQDLCAQNDTNTIGWYFNEYTGVSNYRLYLIDGKQPAVMVPSGDFAYETYRVSMLPHPDGYKIQDLTGILSISGDYQVLSKDSNQLYYYDSNDKKYRTEYRYEVVYSQFDIGICCQDEFYTLPDEN